MRSRLCALLAVLCWASTPRPAAAFQAAPPVFPAGVELVTVDVVVTDKKGVPLTGLTAADFTLKEDGVPQEVASFEAVALPLAAPAAGPAPPKPAVSSNLVSSDATGRSFIVVFDDIHLTPAQSQRAKQAVAEFLKGGVRDGDRVMLVNTAGGVWWTAEMPAGRDDLVAMLKRLDGRHIPDMSPDRISDWEAMRIHVYRDGQIEARVSRRFETYGANASRSGASGVETQGGGDPFVRARAAEIYYQSVTRTRLTLQIMERVLTSLAGARGRKSLVLVSEGFIYDPNLDEFKTVLQASRRSNAAMFFIDTRGLGGGFAENSAEFGGAIDTRDVGFTLGDAMEAGHGSETLAYDSGGFAVKNTNDLSKGIKRIADESRIYYLLGYRPTNTKEDGRLRKIEVKTTRKGVQVRARKGYYAPLSAEARAAADKKKPPETIDADLQAALDSPFQLDAIPLRIASFVFDETLLGRASTVVAAEVDVRELAFRDVDGRAVDAVEYLVVVIHRETGEHFRYDQKVDMRLSPGTRERLNRNWLSIVRDFELSPGGYQAKVVVRDANSKRIGTLVHEFEVPPLSGFRTSSVMLSDTLAAEVEGVAAADRTPRPAAVARRTFAAGGTLYVSYDVYGAARDGKTGMPKVTAGYVVLSKDGGPELSRSEPSAIRPTSLGKLSRLIGTPLVGAPPGRYEALVTLKDEISGKTLEVREPFEIAAAP